MPYGMIAGMKRNLTWLILVGGVIVVLGVLWQAFSIAAYIRGAGEGALDAHVGGSFFVHAGQLAIVIGALVAYWGKWRDVGLAVAFLVIPCSGSARRRHRRAGRLDQRPARCRRTAHPAGRAALCTESVARARPGTSPGAA